MTLFSTNVLNLLNFATQNEISSASNHSAGKVDKCLVKNLVVGYAAADAAKRPDVLR